jgi:RNA polymerase primary sigma factor
LIFSEEVEAMNQLITEQLLVDPKSMNENDLDLLNLDLEGGRSVPEDLEMPWESEQALEIPDELSLDQLYDLESRKLPLLTAEQEYYLGEQMERARQAQQILDEHDDLVSVEVQAYEKVVYQGKEARDYLIRANLRLVYSVARRYRGQGLSMPDLVQEGNVGLITAVDKFDNTRGNRFSTYATWWIRQSVVRAVADKGRLIRLPNHMHLRVPHFLRAVENLSRELKREPSVLELAEAVDLAPERVRDLQRVLHFPLSIDMPVGDEEDLDFGDFIADEKTPQPSEAMEQNSAVESVQDAVATLPWREARILRLRYGLNNTRPHSLKEVGELLGLSRERIRQIEKQALATLRGRASTGALQLSNG